MSRSRIIAAALAAWALAAAAMEAQDYSVGQALYVSSCASCHGSDGRGDGPLAALMTVPTPDLTMLAVENDGAFPMLDVIHTIDGRTGLRAHGGAMPVFGRSFMISAERERGRYGGVLEARGRILSLALYLESVQQP